MLGTQIRMVREGGLQLVDRLGGDAGGENLEEPFESVVEALEPADALLDAEARPGGFGVGTQPGEGREVLVGLVGFGGEHGFVCDRLRALGCTDMISVEALIGGTPCLWPK